MSTVWITRADPGASETAERLRALGHEPLAAPLLTIRKAKRLTADPADYQAVLFTSANGVRAFAELTDLRPRAFCVGEATARTARAAGFTDAYNAEGDSEDLAALVAEALDPAEGPLLHAAGEHTAGDMPAALGEAGFTLERAIVYAADLARALPEEAARALETRSLHAILLHSARPAERLARLAPKRDLERLAIAAISPRAAEPLDARGVLVSLAETPDEEALFAALDRALAHARGL